MPARKQPRDSNGRFASFKAAAKKKPATKSKPRKKKAEQVAATPTPKRRNNVFIIMDLSGSMARLVPSAVSALNEQVATLKAESKRWGIPTDLTVVTFNSDSYHRGHYKTMVSNAFIESVQPFERSKFSAHGGTPLYDAIGTTLVDVPTNDDTNLVFVITDGFENRSVRWGEAGIRDFIQHRLNTDMWTFVFSVPPHSKSATARQFGVPVGSIQEWEQTEAGMAQSATSRNIGTQSAYQMYSEGHTNVASKFFVELGKANVGDVEKVLDEVTSALVSWSVTKESDITSFVDTKLAKQGKKYRPGAAFYELTKAEKVQPGKALLIQEKKTGRVFGGRRVREFLGLPTGPGVNVKVVPGNHGDFNVFVQSTSSNRILPRGTHVLCNVGAL